MPVAISKTSKGSYRVETPGGVKSKGTSKKKALAQKRLLNAIENSDWRPTGMSSGLAAMAENQAYKKKPKKKKRG